MQENVMIQVISRRKRGKGTSSQFLSHSISFAKDIETSVWHTPFTFYKVSSSHLSYFLTFSLSFSQNPSATLYLTSFLICVSRFRARHSCSKKPLLSLPWALLSHLDRGPMAILFAPYTSVPGLGLPFIFCLLFLFSQDIVTSL